MIQNNSKTIIEASVMMTEMQGAIYEVEAFLSENYMFRRNVLNGKTEMAMCLASTSHINNVEEAKDMKSEWKVVTAEAVNSIVRHAKKEGVGGDKSPRQNIEEYINSDAVEVYDPVHEFLDSLPEWDGNNHVAGLFSRIPGITSEQLSWCATWMRSAVAHWLGMDMLHGNECVPILIGEQGCGKSTFAVRLLPEHLRCYFMDHINFGNKFDSEMALTNNLLVNIDEFANMGTAQQGKLKQTLSKVKVNGRPIFGKAQEDRRRYASFLATTNDEHPLCDPTGSRRYICLKVKKGQIIDNMSPINYSQLYAQLLHEINVDKAPYWFGNDQVERMQHANLPYFRSDDMESMLLHCFRLPRENEEGEWLSCKDVCKAVTKAYPSLKTGNATNIRVGQTLKYLGCVSKHTRNGALYHLVGIAT
ncbi:MAG: DUF3874 domain-containing protein [Bacteroidaceae bacterium]|nr:DUF3874 domain-containing protein [Bacteroidaceae bacterium]